MIGDHLQPGDSSGSGLGFRTKLIEGFSAYCHSFFGVRKLSLEEGQFRWNCFCCERRLREHQELGVKVKTIMGRRTERSHTRGAQWDGERDGSLLRRNGWILRELFSCQKPASRRLDSGRRYRPNLRLGQDSRQRWRNAALGLGWHRKYSILIPESSKQLI